MTEEMLEKIDPMEGAAVVEIDEKRIMPLYIFTGTVAMPLFGNKVANIMASALHMKEKNEIEIRGRIRFEDSGNKQMFQIKERFPIEDIHQAKWKIKELYEKMIKEMFLIEIKPQFELDFKIGETIDEVIVKLNQSNEFNIGTTKKK